jgi:L-lactate dehydrogenase complex protein LldF
MAERFGQIGQKPLVSKNGFIEWLPLMLNGWTQTRDLKAMPPQSFRDWWAKEKAPNAEKRRREEKAPDA